MAVRGARRGRRQALEIDVVLDRERYAEKRKLRALLAPSFDAKSNDAAIESMELKADFITIEET
jgi:hypothetical protein